ncbi:hypothetical protein ACFL0V_06320 [Nanoarchaeota archaeon]
MSKRYSRRRFLEVASAVLGGAGVALGSAAMGGAVLGSVGCDGRAVGSAADGSIDDRFDGGADGGDIGECLSLVFLQHGYLETGQEATHEMPEMVLETQKYGLADVKVEVLEIQEDGGAQFLVTYNTEDGPASEATDLMFPWDKELLGNGMVVYNRGIGSTGDEPLAIKYLIGHEEMDSEADWPDNQPWERRIYDEPLLLVRDGRSYLIEFWSHPELSDGTVKITSFTNDPSETQIMQDPAIPYGDIGYMWRHTPDLSVADAFLYRADLESEDPYLDIKIFWNSHRTQDCE